MVPILCECECECECVCVSVCVSVCVRFSFLCGTKNEVAVRFAAPKSGQNPSNRQSGAACSSLSLRWDAHSPVVWKSELRWPRGHPLLGRGGG
jgi:hypothetical protein